MHFHIINNYYLAIDEMILSISTCKSVIKLGIFYQK